MPLAEQTREIMTDPSYSANERRDAMKELSQVDEAKEQEERRLSEEYVYVKGGLSPIEVILSSLFGIGVLIPEGNSLVAIQKAHRMDRKYPASFLLLCMFRSANRENVKNRDLMIDKK